MQLFEETYIFGRAIWITWSLPSTRSNFTASNYEYTGKFSRIAVEIPKGLKCRVKSFFTFLSFWFSYFCLHVLFYFLFFYFFSNPFTESLAVVVVVVFLLLNLQEKATSSKFDSSFLFKDKARKCINLIHEELFLWIFSNFLSQ